jgi:RNA polymerase sigma factor (sigma-70 family)
MDDLNRELVSVTDHDRTLGEDPAPLLPALPAALPASSGPVPIVPVVLHVDTALAAPVAVRVRSGRDTRAEEAEVMAALRDGDRTLAITLLMRHFGKAIHAFVRGMLRNDTLADDIHQQIFIQAHRDFGAFEGRGLSAWLYRIARNRCIDALRVQRRWADRLTDDEVDTADVGSTSADVLLDEHRKLTALAACIDALAPHARTTVLLRFQEGFSFEEMGIMCRERPGTLQQRVARALPFLRRCIEKRLAGAA